MYFDNVTLHYWNLYTPQISYSHLATIVREFKFKYPQLFINIIEKLSEEDLVAFNFLMFGGILHQDKILPLKYLCMSCIYSWNLELQAKSILPIDLLDQYEYFKQFIIKGFRLNNAIYLNPNARLQAFLKQQLNEKKDVFIIDDDL